MQQYLQILSGRYLLLVEANGVLEVLDLSEVQREGGTSHGYRLWRGTSLHVIDLQTLLPDDSTTAKQPQAALVYGAAGIEPPVMVLCDRVVGLTQADEASFRPLPCSEARLNRYIDRILLDTVSDQMLLRLTISGEDMKKSLSEESAIQGTA